MQNQETYFTYLYDLLPVLEKITTIWCCCLIKAFDLIYFSNTANNREHEQGRVAFVVHRQYLTVDVTKSHRENTPNASSTAAVRSLSATAACG